jgi:cytosine deaminase
MSVVAHVLPHDAYDLVSVAARTVIGAGAGSVTVGSPAELVAIPAATIREAIAFGPPGRLVVHEGRVVAGGPTHTETQRSQAPPRPLPAGDIGCAPAHGERTDHSQLG